MCLNTQKSNKSRVLVNWWGNIYKRNVREVADRIMFQRVISVALSLVLWVTMVTIIVMGTANGSTSKKNGLSYCFSVF